jgi:histidine triad (HIT) family protein
MACEICELIRTRKGIVYDDDKVAAFIRQKAAVPGHIIVVPKEHLAILENVPDDLTGRIFSAANRLSTASFEAFGALGTNLMVNNGTPAGQVEPHFMVHILPRKEKDGVSIEWHPQKVDDAKLGDILQKLSLKEAPKEEVKPVELEPSTDENYMLKSLNRIP